MSSIVLELQQEALNRKIRVSDLLRKALVVARKLGQSEFQKWIEKELNGYADGKDIPDYREVKGEVRGWNPYRGWIPLIFEDSKMGQQFSRRRSGQPIAELEHLLEGDKDSSLHMPFPLETQRELSKGFGFETQVSLITPQSSIVGIVDAARTIVLNWSLGLEEQGIVGEGLSFSAKEREVAMNSPQNINNFYGPIQNPQIQQGNQKAVQVLANVQLDIGAIQAFVNELKAQLPNLRLPHEQAAEAKSELETLESQIKSPKPKSRIMSESLRSIRKILEGAGGGVAAQLLIELGKLLF